MDPITNAFILFSAASMLSSSEHEHIMEQKGYYVGNPPIEKENVGIFNILIVIVFVIFMFVGIGVLMYNYLQGNFSRRYK